MMTYEEAYEYFKYRLECGQCGEKTKQREAFICALASIEKQIPKKPVKETDKYISYFYCPNCYHYEGREHWKHLLFKEQDFCDVCGQRMNWNEEPTIEIGEK